jgi:hypothetical protein
MADVRALGKDQRNTQQGFNFRGVDDVMNAVGPALRDHGVSVVPTGVTHLENSTYTTKSGTVMRDVMLVVQYAIHGPAGDTMAGAAAGEASDAGDKATPKAMSVAFRTFLLESLCLPTHEVDPDAQVYERGAEPEVPAWAQEWADRLLGCNDPAMARRVQESIRENGAGGFPVLNADGATETLGDLAARIVSNLQAAEAVRQPPAKGGAAA